MQWSSDSCFRCVGSSKNLARCRDTDSLIDKTGLVAGLGVLHNHSL